MADFGISEIALAATALSAGVGAIGAISSASAQADASRFSAQVASNNAIIAQQQAQVTAAAGEQASTTQALKTRATVGGLKAAQGASGLDVNSGSAVDVRQSASELGMEDQLTLRSNAARTAYGYQIQGISDLATAQLKQREASGAGTAGALRAAGSLLGGASGVGDQFAKFKNLGAIGGGGAGGGGNVDTTSTFFD